MSVLDALHEAWLSIRANALRSGLAVLGIAIGVGALVAVLAIGAGTQADVMRSIDSLGGNLLYVSPATIEAPGVEEEIGVLTVGDASSIAESVPYLVAVAPVVNTPGKVVWRNENIRTNIQGTTNEFLAARDWPIAYGRAFQSSETERGAKVGIIGWSLYKSLFKGRSPESVLGETLRVENMPVEIVGILAAKGLAPQGADQDDRIIVPIKTAQLRLRAAEGGDRTAVESIYIKVQNSEKMSPAEFKIRATLRARHRLAADRKDDFLVLNLIQVQQAAGEASRALQFWLSVVASISLVVGGINIMNVMLVAVTERTREIGVRMALGARPSDIVMQFLAEALVMSFIGGLVGVAAGTILAFVAGQSRAVPVDVDLGAVVTALLFAVILGAAFAAYPAYRAGRQDPVLALKSE